MIILENENLKKYTTIRIGGIAKEMYFPENRQEFINVLKELDKQDLYIIGGGSNLLINDKKVFEKVISTKKMDLEITRLKDEKFYVGASVSIQKLINYINKEGYGGIEYLYSLPALVGGIVAMNAGRGKKYNQAVSDYVEKVYVYDFEEGQEKILTNKECNFEYRHSICKEKKIFVLGVIFNFERMTKEKTDKKKNERIELVRKLQDNTGFNFGSVFRKNNRYIMQVVRLTSFRNKKQIHFSRKTSNWIINKGEGTFHQVISLIENVKKIHKILKSEAITEVIIWK